MAATWSVGAVGIYVDEDSGAQPAVIGEMHVLDATNSTKHHSGSTGNTRRIGGMLADTDGNQLNTLKAYTESDTARTLTSDLGGEGDWLVKNVEWDRVQALNYAYAWYRVSVDLLEPSS